MRKQNRRKENIPNSAFSHSGGKLVTRLTVTHFDVLCASSGSGGGQIDDASGGILTCRCGCASQAVEVGVDALTMVMIVWCVAVEVGGGRANDDGGQGVTSLTWWLSQKKGGCVSSYIIGAVRHHHHFCKCNLNEKNL